MHYLKKSMWLKKKKHKCLSSLCERRRSPWPRTVELCAIYLLLLMGYVTRWCAVCSYARMWCYVVVPYIDVILAVCTYGTIYMHMRAVIGLAEVRLSHYGSLRNPSDVTNEASRRPRVAGCSARCPAVLLTRFSWRAEGPMARLGCEWRLGLLLPRPSGHGGRPFIRGVGVSAGTAVEQAPV